MTQLLVDLTESERERLADLSRRIGKPESAIVREVVVRHLQQLDLRESPDDELISAFGLWKHLGIDPQTYQHSVRSEWDGRSGTA